MINENGTTHIEVLFHYVSLEIFWSKGIYIHHYSHENIYLHSFVKRFYLLLLDEY